MLSLPTLSVHGWALTPGAVAEKAMSYFFTTQYSQSVTFYGNLQSMSYIMAKSGHDKIRLQRDLKDGLTRVLSPYYSDCEVTVHVGVDKADESKYSVRFEALVTDEHGVSHDVQFLVNSSGDSVNSIRKINNG